MIYALLSIFCFDWLLHFDRKEESRRTKDRKKEEEEILYIMKLKQIANTIVGLFAFTSSGRSRHGRERDRRSG